MIDIISISVFSTQLHETNPAQMFSVITYEENEVRHTESVLLNENDICRVKQPRSYFITIKDEYSQIPVVPSMKIDSEIWRILHPSSIIG